MDRRLRQNEKVLGVREKQRRNLRLQVSYDEEKNEADWAEYEYIFSRPSKGTPSAPAPSPPPAPAAVIGVAPAPPAAPVALVAPVAPVAGGAQNPMMAAEPVEE